MKIIFVSTQISHQNQESLYSVHPSINKRKKLQIIKMVCSVRLVLLLMLYLGWVSILINSNFFSIYIFPINPDNNFYLTNAPPPNTIKRALLFTEIFLTALPSFDLATIFAGASGLLITGLAIFATIVNSQEYLILYSCIILVIYLTMSVLLDKIPEPEESFIFCCIYYGVTAVLAMIQSQVDVNDEAGYFY